ncbi:hypothetical protein [Zavarzinella formosa]|uniref:hypothetical protein n=1 Tax=Zavarzinella formosa TaxID=360055 RepID=UPI00035F4188|nr:hypothetical protein [Zavarzinella formosa]
MIATGSEVNNASALIGNGLSQSENAGGAKSVTPSANAPSLADMVTMMANLSPEDRQRLAVMMTGKG